MRGVSGRVWAHVGQPFQAQPYDVAVVGAGRMGALATRYLRQLAPDQTALLVEENGLPNEEGSTILAPGIWRAAGVPASRVSEARWVRRELTVEFADIGWVTRPWMELHLRPTHAAQPTAALMAAAPDLQPLLNPDAHPYASLDEQAATYRPAALALHAAQQAVRLGADLLLNTRAELHPGGLKLERLTVTNTHQIVVHETHDLPARRVVIAAGADGPLMIEHQLGVHLTHARAYRQTPYLDTPSGNQTPLLHVGGLTLRPQHGAFTVIPAIHHRDPHGYAPTGGKLTGVPTGLRRETLEDLISLMDALPVLATPALHLGRSLSDVPGGWLALPHGDPQGLPLHQQVIGGVHLLLGGPQADTLGPSAAYDLAAGIAGIADRPW